MPSITIKTGTACVQENPRINKVIATLDAKNIAKLFDVVGLTANPRKSKINPITKAICETLDTAPEDMRFKSKGLLISTMECTRLQGDEFSISFEDPQYEGVLDGGHNMLAVGLFILTEYFGGDSDKKLKKVTNWDSFVELWKTNANGLNEVLDLDVFDFEIPIEIIYPTDSYKNKFIEIVLDISAARNNNAALTAGTKANHRGYYEILKSSLDEKISENVQWIDNDPDKPIKRDDIVAMTLIPFLALQNSGKFENDSFPAINPVSLYSSKKKCIETFDKIFEKYSDENKNITNSLLENSMKLLKDLPELYDTIYSYFPSAYNTNSPGFGRIRCVKGNSSLTKYYKNECEYQYPDGFIFPIFSSLHVLMTVDEASVRWVVDDPVKFIKKHLADCTKLLVGTIRDNNYRPNLVGKNTSAYVAMETMFKFQLSKN